MFYNELTYFHTLCPILAFLSFTNFESHEIEEKKDCIRATYFTIIYAIILIILNIINVVEGPYPFLRVQENPIWMSIIWFIVTVGGSYLLSKAISKIKIKKK